MRTIDKKTGKLLFTLQGVGAVFICIFLAAYLAGLPSTNVLHSEDAFRIPLAIFGGTFLFLTLATVALASLRRKTPRTPTHWHKLNHKQ